MNTIKLPQYVWDNPREIEFPLPESWLVKIHNIAGYKRKAMTREESKAAICSPIGMPPIRDAAKGKKEVVIIFDDLTRPTKVYEIVPFILEELAAAGITNNKIRFIAAVANHQALERDRIAKKLGSDMVARFAVFNHCPFLNCTYIGTTSYGTRVEVNNEVMNCDFKIGIGGITPHMMTGFSGGGKIILPGVAAYSTIEAFHGATHVKWVEQQKQLGLPIMGTFEENPRNADVQEAAKLAGLDVKIDCIFNMWGDTAALFAGAPESSYKAAIEVAKSHYFVPATTDNNIVIANAHTKASEAYIGLANALPLVSRKGGDAVLIANSPTGQVIHYLFSRFGKTIAGSMHRQSAIPPNVNRIIVYTRFPEASSTYRFSEPDRVLFLDDWDKVVQALKSSYGNDAKVAVLPSADIQYSPFSP